MSTADKAVIFCIVICSNFYIYGPYVKEKRAQRAKQAAEKSE